MRIYIESTIPSYVVARPARDLLQAARQQLTRDWWDLQREKHDLFTSQLVLDEIAAGEREMAKRRLEMLGNTPLLESIEEARELTRSIMDLGLLPARAEGDAAHIALATVHGMDILLTWNCRHIANAAIVRQLRRRLQTQGHILPEIYTPAELVGE
ncbi:DNA-binding protein [Verrucomicrobia bacterium]|nr:DNA-binding protein [Verrucomicrobiota bacterium]